jgi:hypothetical protein
VIGPNSFGGAASVIVKLLSTAHITLARIRSRRHRRAARCGCMRSEVAGSAHITLARIRSRRHWRAAGCGCMRSEVAGSAHPDCLQLVVNELDQPVDGWKHRDGGRSDSLEPVQGLLDGGRVGLFFVDLQLQLGD